MQRPERPKELGRREPGKAPLVEASIRKIIQAQGKDIQAIAMNMERLRDHLGSFFISPSLNDTRDFASSAAESLGLSVQDLRRSVLAYVLWLRGANTPDEGAPARAMAMSRDEGRQSRKTCSQDEDER